MKWAETSGRCLRWMSSSYENNIALIKQCLHVSLRKHIMYVTFCLSLSWRWTCPKGDENIARKRYLYRHSNVNRRDSEVESTSINTLPVMMRAFIVRSFARLFSWLNSDRATAVDTRGIVFVHGMLYPWILIEIDLCMLMHVYSADEYLPFFASLIWH